MVITGLLSEMMIMIYQIKGQMFIIIVRVFRIYLFIVNASDKS
jgi:hypothetical protein